MNRPEYIIVHHTGGTNAQPLADTSHHTFEMVNEEHKRLWNFKSSLGFYIGYHYFIDKQGNVKQGRALADEGAHTKGYNAKSIGICLAGNFDATLPTEAQEKALEDLMRGLMAKCSIKEANIHPHRKFAVKSCYGSKLSDDWARKLVASNKPNPLVGYTTKELINELKRRTDEDTL